MTNRTLFLDKYPVHSLEIQKEETTFKSVPEIMEHLKAKVEAHKIATCISIFDHHTHTKNINGTVAPEIKDAQNIIFCFGAMLPNTKMLAARPRSIGVAELENSFAVEFMEAPIDELHKVMESWAISIKNI